MSVSIQLQNISNKGADEVVQLYITQPDSDHINPKFSLKQFKRIFIGPGEKKLLHFH